MSLTKDCNIFLFKNLMPTSFIIQNRTDYVNLFIHFSMLKYHLGLFEGYNILGYRINIIHKGSVSSSSLFHGPCMKVYTINI